jgi:glycosyltransferase involved in cell wall biosynthesis
MYLPLFKDEHDLEDIPVFYGAISLYLKQHWKAFKNIPQWIERLLNSKPALKLASGMAGSTRAEGLEEMTLSMLRGKEGKQADELDKMVGWIAEHCKPDIIHLSNGLLLGLARRLKEEVKVPIVCTLQDEHEWVESMHPKFIPQVWDLMAEKSVSVDLFISVSDFYQEMMMDKLHLSEQKLKKLYLGIFPDHYEYIPASEKPKSIGFISRMSHGNGLDILIDAFIELRKNPDTPQVNLVITGGKTNDDIRFIRTQKTKLKKAGLQDQVDFHEDFSEEGRKRFFRKISIVSVPARFEEAFGLYIIEAMASGVPVVQPQIGSFPEILKLSGGGITYDSNRPEKLAAVLKDLLFDSKQLDQLSKAAKDSIGNHFHIKTQSLKMVRIYKDVVNKYDRNIKIQIPKPKEITNTNESKSPKRIPKN